jgi:hypothetical protein
MLVAFFKEEKCDVKVIKFADRIWVDEEGNIECHREIYLDLTQGTLRKLFMLSNFRHILEIEDITDTFLDENYLPNTRSTGEYKLVNQQMRRFSIDFIDNLYALPIKFIQSSQIEDCSYIGVTFHNEITGPVKAALRFKFKVNSLMEKLEDESHLIELNYFENRDCLPECKMLNVLEREIKAITLLDATTRSGGLDVLVILPFAAKNIEASEHAHKIFSKLEPIGRYGENKTEVIWHMREFFNNEVRKEIGMANGMRLSIKYSMTSVEERVKTFRNEFIKEYEHLKEEIENIKSANQDLKKRIHLGGILQRLSIVIALIALSLTIILKSCS